MVEKMLDHENIEVKLGLDFKNVKDDYRDVKVVYCGQIDELFDYKIGVLPWRSLRFEEEKTSETLGEAVINEADADVPYTRAHDYKYYQIHQPEIIEQKISIIAKEFPADFEKGKEAYYPVNNEESMALYEKYVEFSKKEMPNMILGGRLGAYQYWDMDKAIKNALDLSKKLVSS